MRNVDYQGEIEKGPLSKERDFLFEDQNGRENEENGPAAPVQYDTDTDITGSTDSTNTTDTTGTTDTTVTTNNS